MKSIFLITAVCFTTNIFSQTEEEAKVLNLSNNIFQWETQNKINLLENVFDNSFVVVNGVGESQTKDQYITLLNSGNFKHDSINVEDNKATVVNNTATVIGKGTFVVTASGKNMKVHLSYIEVFTRADEKADWKVLAMHATVLQNNQ